MTTYQLTLIALGIAMLGELSAARILLERFLERSQEAGRRLWLMLTCGMLVLFLQQSYSIELLLRTGLYDFRQAVLSAIAGVLFSLGVHQLCRRQP